MQMQCWQQYGSVSDSSNATYIRVVQWLVGSMPDINSVTGDDAEMGCCGRECSARTHSSLRGSVSFCSIGCVLAKKFGGEDRIHVFSKTQKSFLEIPPRDDSIKKFNHFLIFPKSKLRKYD